MEKLSFFTPVSYADVDKKTWKQGIFEKVDSYFYLGKRRAYVLTPEPVEGKYFVQIREAKTSMLATALKVVSYVTLIIPLLMLVGKLLFRAFHRFEELKVEGKPNVAPVNAVALTPEEVKTAERALLQIGYTFNQKLVNPKSLCFSPASLAPVLGMVFGGMPPAEKPVYMQKLGFEGWEEAKMHAALAQAVNSLNVKGNDAEIAVANGIAARGEVSLVYRAMVQGTYQAKVLPFNKQAVNSFVERQTRGHVKNLLTKELLPEEICVLLNCLYFAAKWMSPFKKVEKQEFTFADGQRVQAKLMSRVIDGSYLKKEDATLVELPFKSPAGHPLSFVAIVPDKACDVDKLGKKLTPETFLAWRQEAQKGQVDLTLPQLNVDATIDKTQMQKVLEEIGLIPRQPLPRIYGDAYLDRIEQRIKFEVDPEGAKAIVVTHAVVAAKCAPAQPPKLVIDRSFHYFILDGNTPIVQGCVKDADVLVK